MAHVALCMVEYLQGKPVCKLDNMTHKPLRLMKMQIICQKHLQGHKQLYDKNKPKSL